jgi:hypothetical protein
VKRSRRRAFWRGFWLTILGLLGDRACRPPAQPCPLKFSAHWLDNILWPSPLTPSGASSFVIVSRRGPDSQPL